MGSKLIFKLIFIAVIFSSCLLGLRRIAYYGSERNKCEMTYMFEYPQYIVSTLFFFNSAPIINFSPFTES